MSRRTSILKALFTKLKDISPDSGYSVELSGNAYPKLKFWDEVNDFPSVYGCPGTEMRDYLPSNFTWGLLNISLKVYCKGENSSEELESLLDDIEKVIDANRVLVYDESTGAQTTEILITSITTDEGLLAPYAVGEITLQVRYHIL